LRPLAVTSARRSPILPDVPTLAEAGVTGAQKTLDTPEMAQSFVRQQMALWARVVKARGIVLE
jgi:tripartite-type tricarboxylate transporter receptor subunit TctC